MFMFPKFFIDPVLKHIWSHISTNLSTFLKLYVCYIAKNYLAEIQQIADSLTKIG